MLDGCGDDVFEVRNGSPFVEIIEWIGASLRRPCDEWMYHAKDGVVVRFRATTGEDDLLGARVDQRGNLFTRRLDGGASALPESVNRGSIAEFGGEEGKHGVEHGGLDRCGGVVIQVVAVHGATRIQDRGGAGKCPDPVS